MIDVRIGNYLGAPSEKLTGDIAVFKGTLPPTDRCDFNKAALAILANGPWNSRQ
jgi:hypothetical protein